MAWYGMVLYGAATRHVVTLHHQVGMAWYGMVLYGMAWYGCVDGSTPVVWQMSVDEH